MNATSLPTAAAMPAATPQDPSTSPIAVVVVEDSLTIRRHMIQRLEAQAELRVVGEAADEATAVALVTDTAPQAVLLDLSLAAGGSGLNVLKTLRRQGYRGQVHILSHQTPDAYRQACVAAGADGFYDKAEEMELLISHLAGQPVATRPLSAASLRERLEQTTRLAMRDSAELAVLVLRGEPAALAGQAGALADALDLGDLMGWLNEDQTALCLVLGDADDAAPLRERALAALPGATSGEARLPAEALSAGGLMSLADARARGRLPASS